jgi:hypothetical protein
MVKLANVLDSSSKRRASLLEKLRSGHFSTRSSFDVDANGESQKLSNTCCSARHLVALVRQAVDAAKQWAAGSALVERHIRESQTLLDDIHDLRHDVANLGVLQTH